MSGVYPPYLLALRIKLSHYWNISVSLFRKAGCYRQVILILESRNQMKKRGKFRKAK